MNTWVLVKDGMVQNTIVADEAFIEHIKKDFDFCINTKECCEIPSIGWKYDGSKFYQEVENG